MPPPSGPDRQRATKLLADRRAALDAIPASEVLRPRISWEHAITLTGRLLSLGKTYLVGPVPFTDEAWKALLADVSDLEPTVLAYFAAQDVIDNALPPDSIARKKELRAKVRAHDRSLGKWAVPAFEDDANEAPVIAALTPGSGSNDDALDTVAWVAMWKRHPDALGKSPLTPQYLDEAEADATELLPLLNLEDSDSGRRDIASRAYTRWAQIYQRITKAGRFLSPDDVVWPGIATPPSPTRREATTPAPTPAPKPAPVATDPEPG